MKHLVLRLSGSNLGAMPQVQDVAEITVLHAELKTRLAAGLAHFLYEKKDGTIRNAFGTLRVDLLPPQPETTAGAEPDKTPAPQNPHLQKYWDFEAKAWRAFTISKLIAIF